jgi:hypothetical protein
MYWVQLAGGLAFIAFILRCVWRGLRPPHDPNSVDNSTVSIPYGEGPAASISTHPGSLGGG